MESAKKMLRVFAVGILELLLHFYCGTTVKGRITPADVERLEDFTERLMDCRRVPGKVFEVFSRPIAAASKIKQNRARFCFTNSMDVTFCHLRAHHTDHRSAHRLLLNKNQAAKLSRQVNFLGNCA